MSNLQKIFRVLSLLAILAVSPAHGQNDRARQEQAAERARQAQAQAAQAAQARADQRAREDSAREAQRARQTANDNARNARDRQTTTSGSVRGSSSFPPPPPTSRLTFTPRPGAAITPSTPTFNRAASPSQNLGRALPPGTKFSSGGVSNVAKKPTPAEEKRGFTGRFSADGRALVKAQGRVYLVPASRIGVRAPQAATSQGTTPSTKWSPQKQASIHADIRSLLAGGGGSSGGSGGSGAGKSGITPVFNAAAVQGRIAEANQKRLLPSEQKYAKNNINQAALLNAELIGKEIANGHAFEKHVLQQGEFKGMGIRTREQFALHISSVVTNPSSVRYYTDGRIAYIQESSRTVVVRNGVSGEGTAFQPTDWATYISKELPKRTTPY